MTTPALSDLFACPTCGGQLNVAPNGVDPALGCSRCRVDYPIRTGVPRFVAEHYADNFGLEWHAHKRTQFDRAGMTLSRDQFRRYTAWGPEELRGRLVLDAGCGSGRFCKVALDDGARVVAIDLSDAVDVAVQNLAAYQDFSAAQADILALPFRGQTFDAVYSIGVLQHTPDPYGCVEQLLQLCKPGGRVAFWFYGYRNRLQWALSLLNMRYLLRPLLRRIPPRRLYAFVRWYVPKLLPLSRAIRKLTGSCRIPVQEILVPVANRDDIPGVTEAEMVELAILDTFDWYSPRYNRLLSETKVADLMRKDGFEQITRTVQGGLTGVRAA